MNKKFLAYTALFILSEIGGGALMQAFNLPLAASLLSLIQIFFMCRLSLQCKIFLSPLWMSLVGCAFKALTNPDSPDLLAIAMQGLLFTLGIFILGKNRWGIVFSGVFASLWGFLQPVGQFSTIFSSSLFTTYSYSYPMLNRFFDAELPSLSVVIAYCVLLKAFLGGLMGFLSCSNTSLKGRL